MKRINILMTVLIVVLCSTGWAQNNRGYLRPPADLFIADTILQEPYASFNWWAPGSEAWFFYSGVYEQTFAVGADSYPAEYEVAIKFEPGDLKVYQDYEALLVGFVALEDVADYTLKVWMGENADSLVYEKAVENAETPAWNYVNIDKKIVIDSLNTYYFGFRVKTYGGGSFGYADAQANWGKSDLYRTTGDFVGVSEIFHNNQNLPNQNINWNIVVKGALPISKGEVAGAIVEHKIDTKHDLSFHTSLVANKLEATLIEAQERSETPDYYNVYRNNEKIGKAASNEYTDTLSEGGVYKYQVSAVYAEGESDLSEELTVLYDNNRVPKTKVITEVMINVHPAGMGGYSGSASSKYAFKGICDLVAEDTENRVVPIVHHAFSEILGPDPYSNEDADKRAGDYVMRTSWFPMAAFNGNVFSPTISDPPQVTMYREKLAEAEEILTPVKLSGTLNEISSFELQLDLEAKMVGYYPKEGNRFYLAITKDTIQHSWETFETVNFVNTGMIPDYKGTAAVFDENGTASLTLSIPVDPLLDLSKLTAVAFIQNTATGEILDGNSFPLLATGVGEVNALELATKLYPNPAKNELYLVSEASSQFSIYNTAGIKVLDRNVVSKHQTIDISALNQGMYVAVITHQGETVTKRFVKQ